MEFIVYVVLAIVVLAAVWYFFKKKPEASVEPKSEEFVAPYKVEPPVVSNSDPVDNVPLLAKTTAPELKVVQGSKPTAKKATAKKPATKPVAKPVADAVAKPAARPRKPRAPKQ
jgi:hypothetical protein